jgi:hypothetical protein
LSHAARRSPAGSSFALSNIEIHEVKDGDGPFVRYHSDGFIDGTERVYAQDYVSQLVAENGKIKILRKYLNVISTARMLFPNGWRMYPTLDLRYRVRRRSGRRACRFGCLIC